MLHEFNAAGVTLHAAIEELLLELSAQLADDEMSSTIGRGAMVNAGAIRRWLGRGGCQRW